ncbi:MAG: glycosyltransferase family 4 protein [Thermofilaceae archaeon]
MKIVIVVEEFDPAKGYLEYYLARELARLGHKVYLFTFSEGSRIVREAFREEKFEVIKIPYINVIDSYHIPCLKGVAYIIKFIKMEKPDIIHCQPLFSPLSLIFIFFQRLARYKIVGSLITGEYSIDSITAKLKFILAKILIENYIKNKVELFFALNEGFKKILLNLFNIPPQKISIIPLGADPELFKMNLESRIEIRKMLGISSDDIVIVYSGKIIPSKELNLLIEALALVIRRITKVKLLIIGKGDESYLRYLKELCKNLGVSEHVIFYPWVHRKVLPCLYSAGDIAVWPGAPSISIIEAASVGLPLIIKRSPITEYAVAYNNGFMFERGNVEELHKYLEILICNDKLRREMGRNSRLLVEQRLNWKTISLHYVREYMRVLYGT